jgi:hypothetical protein
MRTYDLNPLWRSTIGFDRFFDSLTRRSTPTATTTTHPPMSSALPKTGTKSHWRLPGFHQTKSPSPPSRMC